MISSVTQYFIMILSSSRFSVASGVEKYKLPNVSPPPLQASDREICTTIPQHEARQGTVVTVVAVVVVKEV